MSRRRKKLSFTDKLGLGLALAVVFCLVFAIMSLNKRDSLADPYRARTAAEKAYLKDLRQKYGGRHRAVDVPSAVDIIREACEFIDSSKNLKGVYMTDDAVDLLLGTAIMESDLQPRFQDGRGDAIGLFQIEYGTYRDLWNRSIKAKHPGLYEALLREYGDVKFEDLQRDDRLCAIFSRMKYAECPAPIPSRYDCAAQADYYKRIYNTAEGASTAQKFLEKRNRHLGNLTPKE